MFFKHPLLKEEKVEYREYQDVIAQRILERGNTLVVLPTGLGKTIIELLVSVAILENNECKVLILAPTKPLVNQHYEVFKALSKIKELGVLTGEVRNRREILEKSRVLFATPQTIESMLFKGEIDLKKFCLIIFDEAHRAVGDYAYVFIAERFAKVKPDGLIIGLTASPGGSREKIQEIMQNLFIKNVEVKTEKDEDVKKYIPGKKEEWIYVEFPSDLKELLDIVKDIEDDLFLKLKEAGIKARTKGELLELQRKLIKDAEKNPSLYRLIPIVSALVKWNHAIELLETQGVKQFREYLEKIRRDKSKGAKKLLSDERFFKAEVLAEKNIGKEHPKLKKLVEILKNEGKKAIVFTHYRTTASLIEKKLNEEGIKAIRFVGQSSREGDKGLNQKEQRELIERFKLGEFDVFVATSVGEEGIDLPSVDLVVFYEPIPSEIRKIQRAGRTGRKSFGKVIYLITKGTRDEAFFWVSKHKEKMMKNTLRELSSVDAKIQKTLSEFVTVGKPDKPIVFVDYREEKSGLVEKLKEMGLTVKEITLPVGDYLISDRIAIERKTASDFINSIIDGRLFQQATKLLENFSRPLIIIEGDDFSSRKVHPNAIKGAILSMAVDYGIPVLTTKDSTETAELIALLAKREEKAGRFARLRGEKKPMTDKEYQVYLVEGLPGVGPELARKLLARFGNVENVFTAGEKELKMVEKLGEKKAKEIRRILTKEWEDDSA